MLRFSMRTLAQKAALALCLLASTQQSSAQTKIVGWDGAAFNYEYINAGAGDFRHPYANTGIAGNVAVSTMRTFGGVSHATASDPMGNGNQVVFNQNPESFNPRGFGEGWINGSNGKGYVFSFKTTGYRTLRFSGKIAASNLTSVGVFNFNGARDFKLQHSLNGTTGWTDAGGAITAGLMDGNTLTFTNINPITLPASLDNQPSVYLRLIMTSNNAVGGGTATTQGMVYLDDILVTADINLPITYGGLNAAVTNNKLSINWSTISETNNDHFDIQVSKDGENFTTIHTVKTKAKAGNSNSVIEYSFELDLNNTALATIPAIIGLLALSLLAKKRKYIMSVTVVSSVLILAVTGCSKQDAVPVAADKAAFVRIVQVDKDGTATTSKVLKVTLD